MANGNRGRNSRKDGVDMLKFYCDCCDREVEKAVDIMSIGMDVGIVGRVVKVVRSEEIGSTVGALQFCSDCIEKIKEGKCSATEAISVGTRVFDGVRRFLEETGIPLPKLSQMQSYREPHAKTVARARAEGIEGVDFQE